MNKFRPFVVVLVLAVLVAAAFFQNEHVRYNPAFTGFMNVMHFPAGAALVLILGWATFRKGPRHLPLTLVVVSTLFFGMVEVLQPLVGRSASLEDFVNSLAGVVAGGVLWVAVLQRWRVLIVATVIGAVAVVGLQGWRLWCAFEDYGARYACWPMLEDFERSNALNRWIPSDDAAVWRRAHPDRFIENFPDNGVFGVLGPLADQVKSVSVTHTPVKENWSGYDRLCLELKASRMAQLIMRIDDRLHPEYADRFTLTVPVTTTWERQCVSLVSVRTPQGRPLDAEHVLSLSLTAGSPPTAISLDNLQIIPRGIQYLPPARCHRELN